MAKVTVMVLVYGVEAYIERCARSLFEQTMSDLEYVFVDDCSVDNSIAVLTRALEDYPERKPYVRIIKHDKNRGQAAGRNTALEAVNTEYCIFCDSDDWVECDMYERLYAKAIETNADIVFSDTYNEEKDKVTVSSAYNRDVSQAEDVLFNFHKSFFNISSFNKLVRTRIYIENNIKAIDGANYGEDMLLMLMVLLSAGKIAYLREAFYHYDKTRDTSITNNLKRVKKLQSQVLCNDEIIRFARSKHGNKYDLFLEFITLRNTAPYLYKGKFKEWYKLYEGKGNNIMKFTHYRFIARLFYNCVYLSFYLPSRIKWHSKANKI